jgi:hypothetical protein
MATPTTTVVPTTVTATADAQSIDVQTWVELCASHVAVLGVGVRPSTIGRNGRTMDHPSSLYTLPTSSHEEQK